jgi:hypothetical protein
VRALYFLAGLTVGVYGTAWILDRFPSTFPDPFPATRTSGYGSFRLRWPETTSPAT